MFPLYKDKSTTDYMIRKSSTVLKKLKRKYEIVIVDDGCPEKSGELAKKVAKKFSNIKVFFHKKNLGYGAALKTGLKYANTAAPLIGASGLVYSGQIQKSILEQQAAFSNFQSSQETETYALRKDQRRRELAKALGKQRALYGISGVRLEETPTDIFASTARSFAEDDFYDRYGTAGRIVSRNVSASNLRTSGQQAELGGLLNAELTLARRGLV
mgnify:CR=1 FL=1